MTGDELVVLGLIGAVIWILTPTKKKPEIFYWVDVWVPEKKRTPPWVINVAFIGVVVLLIWAANH